MRVHSVAKAQKDAAGHARANDCELLYGRYLPDGPKVGS
jgi:hypothetical protein